MKNLLRVLIVDDSDDDATLIVRKLTQGGYDPRWERVDTSDDFKSALQKGGWDVILCDYKMPNLSAPVALKILQAMNMDIPFIIVSGAIGEDTAVEVMKAGAHDYLMKDRLARLTAAIDREMREAKNRLAKKNTEERLKQSEESFRHSLDESPLGIRIVSADGENLYANKELLNIYGYDSLDELNSTPHEKRYTPETLAAYKKRKEIRQQGMDGPANYQVSIIRKNGEIRNLDVFRKEVLWNGKKQFQALYSDITKRKQAENNLLDSEKRYRLVVEHAHEMILITQDRKIVFANKAAEELIGRPMEILSKDEFTTFIHPEDAARVADNHVRRLRGEDIPSTYTFRIIGRDETVIWVEMNVTVIEWMKKPAALIFLKDITQHKQLDEERLGNYIRIKKTLDATVSAIAAIVEAKDPYTTGHQLRVSQLAQAIAAEMGLNSDKKDFIGTAAIIHDIGKLSIPSEILSKPTKLTTLEFDLIKTHPQSGYNILKDIEFPWPVATAILQHHERINGSGYPNKLQGKDILLESRILAVADVVEAISSHRPYRPTLGLDFALEEITRNRGILYDSDVVEACLDLFKNKNFVLS